MKTYRTIAGHILSLLIVTSAFLSAGPFTIYGQNRSELGGDVPKSLEVIENWVNDGGRSGMKSRDIFIYLSASDFTLENIRAIFDKYQKEWCDPYILGISINTEMTIISKKIKSEKNPIAIDFADTEAGRKAAEKYYGQLLPAPLGFEAEYFRYGDYEFFSYSPSKNTPALTRVTIREPNKDSTKAVSNANVRK